MSATIDIVVLGKPVGWKRAAHDGRTRRKFVDRDSENYRAIIREAARPHVEGRPLREGKIELSVLAFWPIPLTWPAWRRELHEASREPCLAGADMDNILKAIKDALKGVVYRDDRQVVSYGPCGKFYGERPRVEIKLVEIEPYLRQRPVDNPRTAATRVRNPAAGADLFAGASA